jgi:hypothetical protein
MVELSLTMSTKLQSPEVNVYLQKEEENENENEDQIMKNIDQEIECPRCSGIMTLSSDCDFLLVMK